MAGVFPAGCLESFGLGNVPDAAAVTENPVNIIAAMSIESLSDEELVARHRNAALADREQYVNELFRRNYSKVGRWCLRFTASRESAADLSQEIFTKAYQNLSSFQGQSRFSTWLFSIARNHCLNSIRSNSRQATELTAEVDEDFIFDVPDSRTSPYADAERASSAKLISRLLTRSLDETEKTVFTLHYGEDMPLEAITRLLGLGNQSGAKAYIVSAKRKLARAVQHWKATGQYING